MKFSAGQHVAIRGVVESVQDVGNGREVLNIREAKTGTKIGIWADFCEAVGPEPVPPIPSALGPGSQPAAGTTLHISVGTAR